mgnify:CR=1 FL=1
MNPVFAVANDNLKTAVSQVNADVVFMRHALAPGFGDPSNFQLENCATQRNLDSVGRQQAVEIGAEIKRSKTSFAEVLSSEWCRCKETASIAFKKYETKNFLNSFFNAKFSKNRKKQIIDFDKFISTWNKDQNLIFVTHYVVISEILNYAPSSGEIIISAKS